MGRRGIDMGIYCSHCNKEIPENKWTIVNAEVLTEESARRFLEED